MTTEFERRTSPHPTGTGGGGGGGGSSGGSSSSSPTPSDADKAKAAGLTPEEYAARRENLDRAAASSSNATSFTTSSGETYTRGSGGSLQKTVTPTTSQEFQQSLLQKQGYNVNVNEGVLTAEKAGQQLVITQQGYYASGPKSATINPQMVSQVAREQEERRIGELAEQAVPQQKQETTYVFGRLPEKDARMTTTLTNDEMRGLIPNQGAENYELGLGKGKPESYEPFYTSSYKATKYREGMTKPIYPFLVSPVVGVGKLLYNPFGKKDYKPAIDVGQSNIFYTENKMADKDVQSAAGLAGIITVGAVSAPLALGVVGVSLGQQVYETVKHPTSIGKGELTSTLLLTAGTVGAFKLGETGLRRFGILKKSTVETFESLPERNKIGEVNLVTEKVQARAQIKGQGTVTNYLKTKILQTKLDIESGKMEVNKLNKEMIAPFVELVSPVITATKTGFVFASNYIVPKIKFTTELIKEVGQEARGKAIEYGKNTADVIRPALIEIRYEASKLGANAEYLFKRGQQEIYYNVVEPSKAFLDLHVERTGEFLKQTKFNVEEYGLKTGRVIKEEMIGLGQEFKNIPRDLGIEFKFVKEPEKRINFELNLNIEKSTRKNVELDITKLYNVYEKGKGGLIGLGQEFKNIPRDIYNEPIIKSIRQKVMESKETFSLAIKPIKEEIHSFNLLGKSLAYKFSPLEIVSKTTVETRTYPVFGLEPTKEVYIKPFEIVGEGKSGFIADLKQSQVLKIGEKEFKIEIAERKQATKIPSVNDIYIGVDNIKAKFEGELSYQIDSEFNLKIDDKSFYGTSRGIQEVGDTTFKGLETVKLGEENILTAYLGKTRGKITDIVSMTGKELSVTREAELLSAKSETRELKVLAEKGLNIKDLSGFKKEFFENTKASKKNRLDEALGNLETQQITEQTIGKSVLSKSLKQNILKTIEKDISKSPEMFTKQKLESKPLDKRDVFAGDVVFKGTTFIRTDLGMPSLVVHDVSTSSNNILSDKNRPRDMIKGVTSTGTQTDLLPDMSVFEITKTKQMTKEKEGIQPINLSLSSLGIKQKSIPKFEFLYKSNQKQEQNQAQEQIQAQELITEQITIQKQKQIYVPKPIIRVPPPDVPIIFFPSKSATKKKKKGLFTLQVRRQGKFHQVGPTFETPEQADVVGKLNVRKTLAASYKVESVEERKPVTPRAGFFDFYQSKKEAGVMIQKRGFRLGSFGERAEIQQAKRIRGIFGG